MLPDSISLFRQFVTFVGEYPQLFPVERGMSWSPTVTAFFYTLGVESGFESRCGDQFEKLRSVCTARNLTAFPGRYAAVCDSWRVHGLLDIDIAWVPPGFSVPRHFGHIPVPQRAEILLAVEHEDESTMYRDGIGTNFNVILDEIRKIGNVRTHAKVFSYISSQLELESSEHVDLVRNEIHRIPSSEHLTKQWLIMGIGKYTAPRTRKAPILHNSLRHLFCKGTVLDEFGNVVCEERSLIPYPR